MATFAGLPILASLIPFLLLPFIARVGGAGVWNALALGQAFGSLASILVALGWTLSGPARVAGTLKIEDRQKIFAISVATRTLMFAACVPALALLLALTAPADHFAEAFLMGLAQASTGLSPAWFCVAIGDAKGIARYDILPRLLATLLCVPVMLSTGLIVLYPAALLAGSLVGSSFFCRQHSQPRDYTSLTFRLLLREIWSLRGAAGTTMTAGAYASTPIIVVGAVALPTSLSAFVSAERLYRVGLMAAGALGNSLQGWVAEIGSNHAKRRKFSLLSHILLGLCGLLGLSLVGPLATRLLFGDVLAADSATCAWLGLAFFFVSLNTSTGSHWLVPMGRIRVVFWSTVAGASVGLPAMMFLAWRMEGAGGALGLAIGEFVVCAVQCAAIFARSIRASGQTKT